MIQMPRTLSDEGAAFTAGWEGTVKRDGRHVLYEDSLGHTTIGIGHLVHEGPINGSEPEEFKRGLTDAEAWELFRRDAIQYVTAVDKHVTVALTQRRFDMLFDFAFNWGIGEEGGFPATSILRLVNAQDWAGVAHELVHGRGPRTRRWPEGRPYDKGLEGVRRRRIAEAEAFREQQMSAVAILEAVARDLRAEGISVQFISGWASRGRPYPFNPIAVVCHHTATKGYAYDYPSLGIVRDGRSDLPGPLAQIGIGRHTGTVYVIAAGTSNHAGPGGWDGVSGNTRAWGIEAENDGIGEGWGPKMTTSYLATVAALCRHTRIPVRRVCRHAEWSRYKIDTATSPFSSGNWIRDRVAERLAAPTPTPTPIPTPQEEDEVRLYRFADQWYVTNGVLTRPTNITYPWVDTGAKTLFGGADIKGTDKEGFHSELQGFTDAVRAP